LGWFLFAAVSIIIGLYPILYFLVDMTAQGLLSSKPASLLADPLWSWAFHQHIIFGGVALFIGWIQFSTKIRAARLGFHRAVGKTYLVCALLGGASGLYLSLFANGSWVTTLGFGSMAVLWLGTTTAGYLAIRVGRIEAHRRWMVRSYALCWAAVMLRLYLPTFQLLGMDSVTAYAIISFACWVPNLVVAQVVLGLWRPQGVLDEEGNLVMDDGEDDGSGRRC
jgi:uncharacterized membrane protein